MADPVNGCRRVPELRSQENRASGAWGRKVRMLMTVFKDKDNILELGHKEELGIISVRREPDQVCQVNKWTECCLVSDPFIALDLGLGQVNQMDLTGQIQKSGQRKGEPFGGVG